MSLQVEGEKVKQCRIPGLCLELGILHMGFWSSRRGRRGEPLKAPSALLVTEGSSAVEEGKWGVESERRSEGLKSWRSVVRGWRCCCGQRVLKLGRECFVVERAWRGERERDNVGRLDDHSVHLLCNLVLWDPVSDIKVTVWIEKPIEILHPNNPPSRVMSLFELESWELS